MKDIKRKAVRGGFAQLCGQTVNFGLLLGYVAIMARLLDPKSYGLVAMVTSITGLYGLFASAGLSSATVQRETITDGQISTLFWINMLIGSIFALLCLATAPLLVKFYAEPRLFWVTVAIGAGFIINASGVQHSALIQRQLRYVALTFIETLSRAVGMAVGIGMAAGGFGYWALVAAAIVSPAFSTICMWIASAWVPGMPRGDVGIGAMLRYGGTITLNGLVSYVAYNLEKVLLGRFWGADALGIYGRAYQLVSIPTNNLNAAIGGVTFSTLSRLQGDPARLRNYFLKGYSLVNSLTIPTTIFCALFADDIVFVVLGPKWAEAASIFRFLTPTVLIFGIINPFSWLLLSIGLQGRSLAIALVIAPLVITAYAIGLSYGPLGVAFAYSAALTIWLIPHVLWCVHGTPISFWDLLRTISKPLFSAVVAAAVAFGANFYLGESQSPFLRLAVGGVIMSIVYFWILLSVMGQKSLYLDLLRGLKAPSAIDDTDSQTLLSHDETRT